MIIQNKNIPTQYQRISKVVAAILKMAAILSQVECEMALYLKITTEA